MASVELLGLSKAYGSQRAVNNISLHIDHGLLVCLLGPSGCGKTTTLRLIAGFIEPTGGEIRVGDKVVSAPGRTVPPERRNMSMIFQSYALWPHMTVRENVAYGLTLRKLDRETITNPKPIAGGAEDDCGPTPAGAAMSTPTLPQPSNPGLTGTALASAFAAAGFEHCIANCYFFPIALFIKTGAPDSFWKAIRKTPADFPDLTWTNFVANMIPVTAGNIVGGSLMVAAVYWFVYLRKTPTDA